MSKQKEEIVMKNIKVKLTNRDQIINKDGDHIMLNLRRESRGRIYSCIQIVKENIKHGHVKKKKKGTIFWKSFHISQVIVNKWKYSFRHPAQIDNV